MIQNAQFTHPERNKFFFPENAEAEVHPDVDLGVHPSAANLEIQHPVVRSVSKAGQERLEAPRGLMSTYVRIEEGSSIIALDATTQHAGRYLHWNAVPKDEPTDEAKEHARKVFSSLTHVIVGMDDMRSFDKELERAIASSAFGQEEKNIILPISEPMPLLTPGKKLSPLHYKIHGFINEHDQYVNFATRTRDTMSSWLIDMCVANAHVTNATELLLLEREAGGERSLKGTLSVHEDVEAYLKYFVSKYPGTDMYLPSRDPRERLYDCEFVFQSTKERNYWQQLSTITYYSLTKRREDLTWADADRDILTDRN